MAVDLDALEKLEKEATPAPWEWRHDTIGGHVPFTDGSEGDGEFIEVIMTDSGVYPPEDNDADFIIASRNVFLDFIKELRAARKVVELARLASDANIDDEKFYGKVLKEYDKAVGK